MNLLLLACVISSQCIGNSAAYVLSIGSTVQDTYNVDAGQPTCMVTGNTTVKELALQRLAAEGKALQKRGSCSGIVSTIK